MALRKVRIEGDPLLRKKSRPLESLSQSNIDLIDDMIETMYKEEGVGLAAPQVGVLRRIVVIDIGDGINVFVNPEIIETSGSICDNEGCLSVPDEVEMVSRPEYVKFTARDRDFVEHTYEATGFFARAVCHELDHLDGVLFIDRVEKDQNIINEAKKREQKEQETQVYTSKEGSIKILD